MHEFSICSELVAAIVSEMEKIDPPPRKLVGARIVVGKLRQIVPETMEFAYEVLTKDTPASGSKLEVVSAPIACECRTCDWKGEIEHSLFLCGECESTDLEVTGGRELYLASLEIDRDE